MGKKIKSNFWALLAIGVVVVVATYKILGLYFWHDDFTWVYQLRVGNCVPTWPVGVTVCRYLAPFYNLFGYRPEPYYLMMIVMMFLAAAGFYYLTKSLVLSLMYASAYIGAGAFLEVHSLVYVFPSLILLLFSLVALRKSVILGLVVFILSVAFAPGRSIANIVPFIAYLWLFVERPSKLTKGIVSILAIVAFKIVFAQVSANAVELVLKDLPVAFETIGSLVVPDEILRLVFGGLPVWGDKLWLAIGIAVLLFLAGFVVITKKKDARKQIILGLLWVGAMYAPLWLRANFRLPSNHRYLFYVFPGVLLVWGAFWRSRYWKVISLIVVAVNIVQINFFFTDYVKMSALRASFYQQLHQLLPELPKAAAIYFDAPVSLRNQLADFFRVGQFPTEAAIGTEYGIDYDGLKVETEENFDSPTLAYYWDGRELKNIMSVANKSGFVFPTQRKVQLVARVTDFDLPLAQECGDCVKDAGLLSRYLTAIKQERQIKAGVGGVTASDSWEGTTADSIVDGDMDSYWIADRHQWADKEAPRPHVVLTLGRTVSLDGFIVYSSPADRLPTKINVIDGGVERMVEADINTESSSAEFKVDLSQTDKIDFEIVETVGGDSPVIREIELVPVGFGDLDPAVYAKAKKYPAAAVETAGQRAVLVDYLVSGVDACLHWGQPSHGSGDVDFLLRADGVAHTYTLDLPGMGLDEPTFSIGCTNYPVEVSMLSSLFL